MFIDCEIKKPLSVTEDHSKVYVALWDKYVKEAIAHKCKLRIATPYGTGIEDPKLWRKYGKKFKQVFLRPDDPMTLISNYVHIDIRTPEQKEIDHLMGRP